MERFWQNKKVLVTGADGFIGSHLTEELARLGARVKAFVYYNSFGRWGWLDDTDPELMENVEIFPGDIRDPKRVVQAVQDQEVVFHLASLIGIPYSYHAPDSYVQTNIGGALNILNACQTVKIERLVHTSTSEVYGTAKYVPIDESHPLQGQSPYSASKIGADMMAMSYFNSFALPVVLMRPFNTYGPRQSARAVIPTIISQILNGKKTIKLGSLHPTRDFNFVADTVAGFLAAVRCDKVIGQVVNFGSGKEISVGDLVKKIINILDKSVEIVSQDDRLRPAASEVERLLADASKARNVVGWSPKYSLDAGLTKTIKWIEQNLSYFKPAIYNI